jgi:hypothetical protein
MGPGRRPSGRHTPAVATPCRDDGRGGAALDLGCPRMSARLAGKGRGDTSSSKRAGEAAHPGLTSDLRQGNLRLIPVLRARAW